MSKLRWIAGAGVFFAAVALAGALVLWTQVGGLDPTNPKIGLSDIEATVSRRYKVPEMSSAVLAGRMSAPDIVLFDVREPDEFALSHIAGAQRVDPGMNAQAFLARYGRELKGKVAVFYCAVGVRSGIMLDRVQAALPGYGVSAAYNLRGGIFRWHATGQPVRSEAGEAGSVHPYDEDWKQLLDRTLPPRGR
ncbi:MAG: rhodanese-like domain-containing protein [Hyphomicrobiaceae bacterium]